MIKTDRISHIETSPLTGFVRCPSCRASVRVDVKLCPHCGEIVNYSRNRELLLNWKVDLFNYRIDDIRDGLVSYRSPYVGDNYHNFYSLDLHRNVIPEEFTSFDIRYYRPGAFVLNTWNNGKRCKFGVLDKVGNVIISPICEDISDIDERGHFIVKYEERTGINNLLNQNVIPFEYDSIKRASLFDKDFFIVEKSGRYGMIDINNQFIVPLEFDSVGERGQGPIPVCREGKWGFYDQEEQQLVIPFKYSKAESFKGNCAKVYLHDTVLFIDAKGFPALPEDYGEKQEVIGRKLVIRDINGNVLKKQLFDPIQRGRNTWPYKVGEKEGLITFDGEFVIPPEYDELFMEESGLCAAKKNDKWGVLSSKGEIVLPFESLSTFISDGIIYHRGIKNPNGGWQLIQSGYVNRYGDTIIPFEYISLSAFHEGLCWYEGPKFNQYGIMDKFGNYIEYHGVVRNGNWVVI